MSHHETPAVPSWTVARYLLHRLRQLGITHLFGVPGDHLGPFLDAMEAEGHVAWVGTPTEGGAGQAADAYARVHGIGAAAVTYSVGAFGLLNAVGGCDVEYVPLIAINASPRYEQWQNHRAVGLLSAHMGRRPESNLDVFRQVTCDTQAISNPGLAPLQIDTALTACLSECRPVYLEILEDLWDAPCAEPVGTIERRERPLTPGGETMLEDAVEAILEFIESNRVGDRPRPILWVGEEIDRFRLGDSLISLLEETGIPYCTTIGAKAVVSENLRRFVGVYNGDATDPAVRRIFKEWADCRIGLGSWTTSGNLSGERTVGTDWSVAAHGGISVGTTYFPDVRLALLVPALRDALVARYGRGGLEADYYADARAAGLEVPGNTAAFRASVTSGDTPPGDLTYDGLFARVNGFLTTRPDDTWTVLVDTGFAQAASINLRLSAGRYLSQNSWLSIGWTIGAAVGAVLGHGEEQPTRPMVFAGDGAFQETCQEISTHTRLGLRSVVFILDNENFYGIEQMLIDPCYYKKPYPPGDAAGYNVLHPWNYDRLAEVFHTDKTPVTGITISDGRALDALFDRLADPTDAINAGPILVRLRLDRHDFPHAYADTVAACGQRARRPRPERLRRRVGRRSDDR
ncbi:decarboxylase [Embleya scabrispora]|uniref:Alpha-keto-acid decarboxylase n=1 Tax=Embleya scabrispora TaxID=159449 RepID=A0A1T3NLF6_9ACTN|nr:thiamine pyrophosphate-binding protein [Embleya scabrispora]OPC77719.1 decarboxylase [Embleya scabrispora]